MWRGDGGADDGDEDEGDDEKHDTVFAEFVSIFLIYLLPGLLALIVMQWAQSKAARLLE